LGYSGIVKWVAFNGCADTVITVGKVRSASWADFVAEYSKLSVRVEKDGPGFCPNVFAPAPPKHPKAARVDACVYETTMAGFDFDSLSDEEAEAVVAGVEASGYECFLYTTHSHAPPSNNRFRLVFPLSRPVAFREHRRFRQAFYRAMQWDESDITETVNESRFFIAHATHPARVSEAFTKLWAGKPIDVDSVLQWGVKTQPVVPTEPIKPASTATTPYSLFETVAQLKKVRDPKFVPVIKAMFDGRPLADEGHRDTTLQAFLSFLVYKFPHVSDAELLGMLGTSLHNMGTDDDWVAKADEKLARIRSDYEVAKAEETEFAENLARTDRLEASGGKSGTPYTSADLERYASEHGCTVAELLHRLVIQHRSVYFFFSDGQYVGPFPTEAADNTMRFDLARASEHVHFTSATKTGFKEAKIQDVTKSNGRVATQIIYTYLEKNSRYDPQQRALNIATAPLRDIEPKCYPEIHRYLEIVGGSETERLLDYVATFTQLEHPTCALYLEGPKNSGKSLLAYGLARLYSSVHGPVKLKGEHLVKFNDDFLKNPVLFIDEVLPGVKGESASSLLRELITSNVQALRKKHLDGATLHGAVRLICAANNDNLIRFEEDLNRHDMDALAERYFHLKIGDDASEYLESLGGRRVIDTWVKQDKMAAHALWLRDTRKVEPYGRLLVSGKMEAMRAKLTTSSGIAPEVCQLLVKALIDKTTVRDAVLVVKNGEVWANAGDIVEPSRWTSFVTGRQPPKESQVTTVLRNLAAGVKDKFRAGTERNPRWRWKINAELLIHKAEELGLSDREDILASLRRPTPVSKDASFQPTEAEA
jgi:hypothetical protein